MAIEQNIKVTVDAVIFSASADEEYVLLVKRKNAPFKGQWVLPGGFVDDGENLETAALRELQEETSLKLNGLKQLKAYGDPGRDPRFHTVSVAHWGIVNKDKVKVKAASDADEVRWFKLNDLPKLGFDHARILQDGSERWKRERID